VLPVVGVPRSPIKYDSESGLTGTDSSSGSESLWELLTVTETAFELPPPGVGFTTTTERVPAELKLVAGRVAIICVAETYEELIKLELRFTVEVGRKFEPASSTWVAVDPTPIVAGATDATAGSRLSTTNAIDDDGPPPGVGFVTTTGYEPAKERSALVSEIVS
jgi:hypothetical protein